MVRHFLLFLSLALNPVGCSKGAPPEVEPETEVDTKTREDTPPTWEHGEDARLFQSPAAAIETLLSEQPLSKQPRVIGFGEYHKLVGSAPVHSALRRFAEEIFDVLSEDSSHLVLETWQVDPACGKQGAAVRKQVERTIERAPETESEMQTLLRKMRQTNTIPLVLNFSCKEYKNLVRDGSLDTEQLLSLISIKLGEQTQSALATSPPNKMVLVYGGATHNDLFPYAGLEHWSYAKALSEATHSAYLEIDLYVPELVQGNTLLSQEAWYPLLKEARSNQVILVRRDPASYILILRKDYGPSL